MKIRIKSIVAGPDYRAAPGDIIDRPPKEAKELIKGGYAEAVQTARVERATAVPPEQATAPAQKQTQETTPPVASSEPSPAPSPTKPQEGEGA